MVVVGVVVLVWCCGLVVESVGVRLWWAGKCGCGVVVMCLWWAWKCDCGVHGDVVVMGVVVWLWCVCGEGCFGAVSRVI